MKKSLLLSTLFLLPLCLPAQEALTLEQCRQMALSYNKEISAAAKQALAARYTARSYRGNFFPNLTATGTGLYSNADGSLGMEGGNLPVLLPDAATGQMLPTGSVAYFPGINLDYKVGAVYTGGIQLDQPLYMGGKIRAAYRMSLLGQEMARMNETLTATEVILKTEQAYALVVKAKEMKTVADRYHELLAELMKNVESAHRHGLKAKNDVLKVQVKLNESELAVRKAENALRLATMSLCHCIGKPLAADIRVESTLPEVAVLTDMQANDISSRPEYGILESQTAIARQQVRLTRSELLPQVGVRGTYNYLHGLELNNQTLFDKGIFSVMLNVSIPLYHFGERSNKLRAARTKLEQTRLEQENLNEQMLLELAQAANNLDEAQLECRLAERSLEQAEENMRVSRSQYDVGLETLSDHLEAQALWQQAYETKVDAAFQLYLNHLAYRKAAGKLM